MYSTKLAFLPAICLHCMQKHRDTGMGIAGSKVRYVMDMESIYLKKFSSMLMMDKEGTREVKINATSALFRVVISSFCLVFHR